MLRNANLLLIVLGSALGCSSPKPTRVYVDLSQVPVQQSSVAPVPYQTSAAPSGEYRIEARPGVSLLVGLSEARLKAALEESLENRRVVVARILEQRLEESNRQFASRLRSELRVLEEDQWKELESTLAQTRVPFDKVADRLGALQLELADLVGFPDQGNPNIPDAEWARKRLARADEIRTEMAELEAQYIRERNAILRSIAERYLDRASELEVINRREAQASRDRILREFRLSNEPIRVPRSEVMTELQIETADDPAAPITWESVPATTKTIPGGPGKRFNENSKVEWAKLWAGIREYTLVSSPAEGENRTAEFIKWLRDQKLIPSPNSASN